MTAVNTSTRLTELTIEQAGEAFRAGSLSPVELTEAYLAGIDARNGELAAYITVTAERARQDAGLAADELSRGVDRGPLHGIPMALKDLIDTERVCTTAGCGAYRDRVPAVDATVAARLREAGAVLLGKTNTHELAFGVTTTNPHFGVARNPHDPSRIPGGSSGGNAVALAAGMAAGAVGTDTGGSIRIPAAMCGCVGLKPTFGRVSASGVAVMSRIADHVGPMTRTVADAALLLGVMAGYDPADPNSVPMPVSDYRGGLGVDLTGIRIGVPRAALWGLLDDDVRAAGEQALIVLASLGARMVDVALPDHGPIVGNPGEGGFFGYVLEESRHAHRAAWRSHPELFGPDLRHLYSAPPISGGQVAEALAAVGGYRAAVHAVLRDVDLLVSPTVPVTAPPVGAQTVLVGGVELPVVVAAVLNTVPFNLAGVPAISVPCQAEGLPIGLQLAGRPFDEASLLRAAHAYEQARAAG